MCPYIMRLVIAQFREVSQKILGSSQECIFRSSHNSCPAGISLVQKPVAVSFQSRRVEFLQLWVAHALELERVVFARKPSYLEGHDVERLAEVAEHRAAGQGTRVQQLEGHHRHLSVSRRSTCELKVSSFSKDCSSWVCVVSGSESSRCKYSTRGMSELAVSDRTYPRYSCNDLLCLKASIRDGAKMHSSVQGCTILR